jgi:TonB family protein
MPETTLSPPTQERPAPPAEPPVPPVEAPVPTAEAIDAGLALFLADEREDRKTLRRALLAAALFHLLLLMVTFPNLASPKQLRGRSDQKVYVVQQLRFKPPAAQQQRQVPKPKAKRIPIPDPTPDEPEPLPIEDFPEPEMDLPELDGVIFGIPDAPPGVGSANPGAGDPIYPGDGITAPKKIVHVEPRYTEEARQARIQGTVILQAVVDVEGNVSRVQVIKGLPFGLDQSAIDAVEQWKYEPARRSDGTPVAVYYNLVINFSLQ